MLMRTKIAITAVSAIIGGYGLAYAATGNVAIWQSNDYIAQSPTSESQPQESVATSAPSAEETITQPQGSEPSNEPLPQSNTVEPTPAPKPQPKPEPKWSDTRSAETPCRLYGQNTYTNQCEPKPEPQQDAQTATQPEEPAQPPQDNSGAFVNNQN